MVPLRGSGEGFGQAVTGRVDVAIGEEVGDAMVEDGGAGANGAGLSFVQGGFDFRWWVLGGEEGVDAGGGAFAWDVFDDSAEASTVERVEGGGPAGDDQFGLCSLLAPS